VRKKREEGKGKRGERRRQVMWEKGKRKRKKKRKKRVRGRDRMKRGVGGDFFPKMGLPILFFSKFYFVFISFKPRDKIPP
jgi:hypothetical protein